MTKVESLHQLLTRARDGKWCVKPYCTTCGARDYRRAIYDSGDALVESLRTARLSELRREFRELAFDDAIRLLFMELSSPFGLTDARASDLESELAGSEAGDYLTRMQRHVAQVRKQRAERATYDSPEAVAERRRVKQAAKVAKFEQRALRKAVVESTVAAALAAIEQSAAEALVARICEGSLGINLYRLPIAQIYKVVSVLATLPEADLHRLRERVPRTRVQPLAELSKAIDAELKRRPHAR